MTPSSQHSNATSLPDQIAYHVAANGNKEYWTRIGAAWTNQDGKGLTLILDCLPVDGKIVLRQRRID